MDESMPDEVISPSSTKSINDLPPELLSLILEFAMLGVDRKTMLGYRLTNSQWKDVFDSIIEKKMVSGEFPSFEIFPAMFIKNADDQLELPVSAPGGENPFPFNTLRLMGTTICAPLLEVQERRLLTRIILPQFLSNFAGTLTTFCFEGEEISIKALSAVLGSMSNLKRLSLQVKADDTITELGAVLPTPPPLPCLTTLNFKSLHLKRDPSEIEMIYVWLLASYANQLVRLDLNIFPFSPLQASHEYTHSFPGGQTCSIATTSEVAFRKLKELAIRHHSREFLILSETPALRRLTLYSEDTWLPDIFTFTRFHLEDVINIIDKCSNTLETVILNMPWEVINSELTQLERPMAAGAVVPRLKSLTVHYPFNNTSEVGLYNFLIKLPGLKTLKLIKFWPHKFDRHTTLNQNQNGDNEAKEVGNENNQNADEIVALKDRLASLFERMTTDDRKKKEASAAIDRLVQGFEEGYEDYEADDHVEQLEIEINDLSSSLTAARGDRTAIFQRLTALGENKEKVMVQQLLERGDFWSSYPSLETVTVSVSSGENPDGNVFLVRRGDSA